MRKRVAKRIALAALLFLTGSIVGTTALSLFQQRHGEAEDPSLTQFSEERPKSLGEASGLDEQDLPTERIGVSDEQDSEVASDESVESTSTTELDRLLASADRLAQQGNVSGALMLYQQISRIDPVYQGMNIRLRSAFCTELTADYRNALRAYQSIVDEAVDARFVCASQLGIARVNSLLGEPDKSHKVLWHLFLNEASYRASDQMRSRVLFALINQSVGELAKQLSSASPDSIQRVHASYDEMYLMQEMLSLDYQATKAVSEVDSSESREEQTEEEQNQIGRESGNFHLISCDILLAGANKLSLLEQVAQEAGLVLKASDAASDMLKGQFRDVNCRGIQLELFLDALLVPTGIHWSIDNATLNVVLNSESEESSVAATLSAVERLIRYSMFSYPESESASLARVDLVNIEFWRNNYASAIQQYKALLREPQLRRQISMIRFNIGIAHRRLGDDVSAEEQFQRVVDNGLTESLLANAHYLLGEIQLASERAKESQRSFAHAFNAAKNDELKKQCCVAQACAYLVTHKPYGVLQVMKQNAVLFQAADERKTAAFLVAFARYEILGREDREADHLLLSSLSHVDPNSMPRLVGHELVADAYHQLGFSRESIRSLEAGVHFGRSRMELIDQSHAVQLQASQTLTRLEFQLAERYLSQENQDAARQLFKRICSASEPEYRIRSLLRLASLSRRQQRLDEAIEFCRQAITTDVGLTSKNEILRLLGDVLADKGNRITAAMCYAGLMPTFEEL